MIPASRLLAALSAAATLALAGCAAPQAAALRATPAIDIPERVKLGHVPFHPQLDYYCGPSSLAMVMGAAGKRVHPDDLAESVFLPARQGSLQPEMLAAPRRHGLLATRLPDTLETLLREVAGGTPVVVLQNLSLQMMPRWHYAVVIGYDLPGKRILMHSGEDEQVAVSIDRFEHTWARGGHWAMAVTEPSVLPRTADEAEAVRAAVALERTDKAAAALAYGAVLRKWPENRLALFGQANLLFAGGDTSGAIAAYRRAVAAHPEFGDAWNNLAIALNLVGERAQARAAADRALAIGGPHLAAYGTTRAKLDD